MFTRCRVQALRIRCLCSHHNFLNSHLIFTILVKYSTAYEIDNLDYWQRKDTHCGYVLMPVCVCKSMTVNGRNPSTNPHLSSWITDIINRHDSSISPVFPIQRWGAGLFPTLSADLMTFTKLPYSCVYRPYVHEGSNVFLRVCVSACVGVMFVLYYNSANCCLFVFQ